MVYGDKSLELVNENLPNTSSPSQYQESEETKMPSKRHMYLNPNKNEPYSFQKYFNQPEEASLGSRKDSLVN